MSVIYQVIQYLLEHCRSESKVELNKKLLLEIAEDHAQAELVKEIIERTCSWLGTEILFQMEKNTYQTIKNKLKQKIKATTELRLWKRLEAEVCSLCEYKSTEKGSLKRHIKSVHKKVK